MAALASSTAKSGFAGSEKRDGSVAADVARRARSSRKRSRRKFPRCVRESVVLFRRVRPRRVYTPHGAPRSVPRLCNPPQNVGQMSAQLSANSRASRTKPIDTPRDPRCQKSQSSAACNAGRDENSYSGNPTRPVCDKPSACKAFPMLHAVRRWSRSDAAAGSLPASPERKSVFS